MVVWTVLVLLAGYTLVAVAFYLLQGRMMFRPDRMMHQAPTGLSVDEVTFRSLDGCRLHGWFVPSGASPTVVLYCHGNSGNVSTKVDMIELVAELGVSVFCFDYRGYGLSQGTPSERGLLCDAEAAWTWLVETRGVDPSDIVVLGRSLGGAVAARLAALKRPAALVLDSTFTSMVDLARHLYWYLPCRLLCRVRFDTISILPSVACPVMVMHSREDDLIPFEHGKRLFAAAAEPRRFVELRGDHRDAWIDSDSLYGRSLEAFLQDVTRRNGSVGVA